MINQKEQQLNKSWISGFCDGESCFYIRSTLRKKNHSGFDLGPSFSITQNKRNKNCLELINKHFKVGNIRFDKTSNCFKYEVRVLRDIKEKILPHFLKYPLLTNKKYDWIKFFFYLWFNV